MGVITNNRQRIGLGRVLDGVWLVALTWYILAGYAVVPFHGDESTVIFMSHDHHLLVQDRDWNRVLYRATPDDPAEQDLRILNGTVSKMAIGLAWDMAGLTVDDLNEQWVWGGGWEWNLDNGHMPSERLLRAARLSSTLLLVISAWGVFGIAYLALRSRLAAWAASAIYVTTPVVLLNGRRAMFEGSHLCFAVLTILIAMMFIREQRNPDQRPIRLGAWAIMLGVMGGLAIASKHTAVITVMVALLAVSLEPLIRPDVGTIKQRVQRYARQQGAYVGLSIALVVGVFLALNPAWWSDPLGMPERVFNTRQGLLRAQLQGYGGYTHAGERIGGLVESVFFARPQYHEVLVWEKYIGDQIARYEGRWYAGRSGGIFWGAGLLVIFTLGIFELRRRWRTGLSWVLLVWLGIMVPVLLILTPFSWQRYYLPLQPPVAVVCGLGVAWLGSWMQAQLSAKKHINKGR